jgi:hypothetical protein
MRRRTHHIRDAALVTRVRDAIGEYLCSTLGYDDSLVDLDEEVATNDEEVVYRYRTDSQVTRRIWFSTSGRRPGGLPAVIPITASKTHITRGGPRSGHRHRVASRPRWSAKPSMSSS